SHRMVGDDELGRRGTGVGDVPDALRPDRAEDLPEADDRRERQHWVAAVDLTGEPVEALRRAQPLRAQVGQQWLERLAGVLRGFVPRPKVPPFPPSTVVRAEEDPLEIRP